MTPAEFKAWFEGFCEAVADAPTPEQWEKIKQRVAMIGVAQIIPSQLFPGGDYIKPTFPPFEITCQGIPDAPATMKGGGGGLPDGPSTMS